MVDLQTAIDEINTGKIEFDYTDEDCCTTEGEVVILLKRLAELEKADFVEVVRCKDCDVPHNKWTGCPYMNGLIPPPNHFCSYGERKDT